MDEAHVDGEARSASSSSDALDTTTERPTFLLLVGFSALASLVAVAMLWCDLAYEETKTLHHYTHWCSAGLIS